MTNRIIFFFLSFLLSSQILTSMEEIDSALLNFEKKTWNMGLSRFSGTHLEKQNEYLLTALPLLLLEDLSDITSHHVTEADAEAYTQQYRTDQILRLRDEKSQLHKQRDSLLFSDLNKKENIKKYNSLTEDIEKKGTLISQWQNLKSSEIHMPDEIPVQFQRYTDEQTKLSEPWAQKSDFMDKEDLDLLITGHIEKLEDIFFLTIDCYIKFSDHPVLELQDSGSEEELNDLLIKSSNSIRTILLGRSWSELSIKTTPDNALIILDGLTMGVGSYHSRILEPGFVTCTVKSSGFVTYSNQEYLAAENSVTREITLEPGHTETLSIFSDPPDADVYFGALWMGKTPLLTGRPLELELLKISKDNFMPFIISTDKLESDSLTVKLNSSLYDKKKKLDDTKSAFYRSLGWFSLSIGIPLVLSGIYQNLDNRYYSYAVDYITTANPESYDKALYYRKYADISYYSFWGGIAVSGSLFINTLFKLRNYIIAAEESTED